MDNLGTESRIGPWQVFRRGPQESDHRALLLPGGFCTALTYIDVVAEPTLTEARIETWAANPPGFGQNAAPDRFGYATTDYADLIEEFAQAEALDTLVGHSLSANVLIEVAARNNYSGKIILLDPCLRYRNEYRGVRLLRRAEMIPPLARRLYVAAGKNVRRSMQGLVRPDRLDMIVDDMQRVPPEENRAVINGYFDHLETYGSLAKRLADARGDVHFVRGDAESIGFDREDIQSVVAQENVVTHTITGSDHMTMLDNPPEVAALIASVATHSYLRDAS